MSDPFIGEIRMWANNFAPRNWAFCDGQLMPIAQNTALFAVLGAQFGGDGRTNFGLPDLQGRAPMGQGAGPGLTPRHVGDMDGTETVQLTDDQVPPHTHAMMALQPGQFGIGNSLDPANNVLATPRAGNAYVDGGNQVEMAPALPPVGGGGPHNNLQPYLVVNFCIALQGLFPSRT